MDTAIVRQFLSFFQDFLNLCQAENWPDNQTTEVEIKNAFLVAQHIEKCLNKFQKRNLLDEFLASLNNTDMSKMFFKNCLADPPKYILKRIISSKTSTVHMDIGFKVFLQLYSEEKLEDYLADLMLEAASKETLLRNLSTELSKERLLDFKSQLLLMELNTCEDSKESLKDLLQNCSKDTIELLVVSVSHDKIKFHNSIDCIKKAFMQIMISKSHTDKQFWKFLFNVDEQYLTKMCLQHEDLFKMMVSALLDCGKLLRKNMCAEYFYIDLSYSELVFIVRKICKNDNLRLEFFDIVRENSDKDFWEHMLS